MTLTDSRIRNCNATLATLPATTRPRTVSPQPPTLTFTPATTRNTPPPPPRPPSFPRR